MGLCTKVLFRFRIFEYLTTMRRGPQFTYFARFTSDDSGWRHWMTFCTLQSKMFQEMIFHFDKTSKRMWMIQQADGIFEKEWYESNMSSTSFILSEAALRAYIYAKEDWNTQIEHLKIVMRSVDDSHILTVPWRKVSAENMSLKIVKSVTDLFNYVDEIPSQQLIVHQKTLVAELQNMEKDLFETIKSWKVSVIYRDISFLVVRGLSLLVVHVALDAHVVEEFWSSSTGIWRRWTRKGLSKTISDLVKFTRATRYVWRDSSWSSLRVTRYTSLLQRSSKSYERCAYRTWSNSSVFLYDSKSDLWRSGWRYWSLIVRPLYQMQQVTYSSIRTSIICLSSYVWCRLQAHKSSSGNLHWSGGLHQVVLDDIALR